MLNTLFKFNNVKKIPKFVYFSNRNMSNLKVKLNAKCFGGYQKIYAHDSKITQCEMRFSIYLPPQSEKEKLPVIYFLSGLTMDHWTFIDKSGCQKIAAELGVIIVAPDSSPPELGIIGEKSHYSYGRKASYYIDCTNEPWNKNYKMHSYLASELPELVTTNFPVLPNKQSIIGFSIGGYGAFMLTMKNPNLFVSVSAMAPVCDVTLAPRSMDGLKLYLGEKSNWDKWSSVNTAKNYNGPPLQFYIDQGTTDEFLKEHLHTDDFQKACESSPISIMLNYREGYGHDFFFIKTFLEDHIKYHMNYLK